MEITINLQLTDSITQYSVDIIDIVAAYKLAKVEYFKDTEYDPDGLIITANIILQNLIMEQVSADSGDQVLSLIEDENLALLKSYVAKVIHVLEL